MARAIAYVRVSMEGGRGDDMISPAIQLDAIQRHCEQQGHRIVETLEDIDRSGKFWKRRQVERAVKMIEDREADVLVVWKLSRISRNRRDWALAVDRVEGAGGRLESATEPLDTTTSSGRFARGVLAELAAFESERIGEAWKETHANRVMRGLPHAGAAQFGYVKTRDGYAPDPETAPVLRQLYLDFANGRRVKDLIDLSGAHGGPISDYGVKKMLDRGFGAGYLFVRGELVEGSQEPVVSPEEFRRYQVARRKRSKRPRAEASPFAFSGLVVCECGRSMAGNTLKDRHGQPTRRYYCPAVRVADGHTNNISEAKVDEAVLAWLGGYADRISAAVAVQVQSGVRRTADARPKIRRDLAKAADRIEKLTLRWIDGDVDKGTYESLLHTLREQRDGLQERLDALDEQEASKGSGKAVVTDLLALWDKMPARVKRAAVAAIVGKVVVPRGRTRYLQKPVVVLSKDEVA